jgi:hypothetical protein
LKIIKKEINVFKTGDKVPSTGSYDFVRYVDAPAMTSPPTANEQTEYLREGTSFPAIRSTKLDAVWQKASA